MFLSLIILFLLFKCGSTNTNTTNEMIVTTKDAHENWVNLMGTFNHSLFKKGGNKLNPCLIIKVHKNPKKGQFVSVQNAIDSVPEGKVCRVVISVNKGIFREKVEIPMNKAYITLSGKGSSKTIIEWDDTAETKGDDGKKMGTYASATVAVNSPYFIAKDMAFKNKAPAPPSGALGKQAVALRISADMAAFIRCKFIGAQDTLYDHIGRHYFKNCHIQGSIDFIFGNGLSLYYGCRLHAKTDNFGSLTAQKRQSLLEETGFSFVKCRITGSGALYLGRAWGSFSRVIFAYTYMDKIILPKGWYDWGDKSRHMTVFYGQYKCFGPGAQYGARVSWSRELTKQEAQPFISLSFIDGLDWLPDL